MTQVLEKQFYSTVRRTAICGGPLAGMPATIVEFMLPPEVEDPVDPSLVYDSETLPSFGDIGSSGIFWPNMGSIIANAYELRSGPSSSQLRTLNQIISSIQASLGNAKPTCLNMGVLCVRLTKIKGVKQALIELLANDLLPPFRVLYIEAPDTVSVTADFLRTLRNACPSGRQIAWTTICLPSPDMRGNSYAPTSWHVTAKNLASFTRHGFLHTVKFLSSGLDEEFESIVACLVILNSSAARSDLPHMEQLTVYIAPNQPYDSYITASVQTRCLRYGYSFAPL